MRAFLVVLIACSLLLGCKRAGIHSSGDDHDHGTPDHENAHEAKTAQLTIWTNGYEIFAEHPAPVAGEATRFVTHVSHLATGLPRQVGAVKFVLTKGGKSFEILEAQPERAGVYIPTITFPSTGDWSTKLVIPGESDAVIEMGIIKVHASSGDAARAEFPEAPEGVSFLKEQQWRIAQKTDAAHRGNVTNYLIAPATVRPAPGKSAAIHPIVAGRIATQETALGSRVEAGQVLGWIEPAFGEATAQLVTARSEAARSKAFEAQARQQFDRVKALHAQGAKTERELQDAEAAFLAARATHEAAQSVASLFEMAGAQSEGGALRIPVKSPISGTLEGVYRHAGERALPEEPLYRILDSSSAQIEARLAPSQLAPAANASVAFFEPSYRGAARVPVRKVAASQTLDPVSRLGTAVYQLDTNTALPIGSVGNIRIAADVRTNAIVIRTSAIVDDDGMAVAFVQLSGETFAKRDLKVGIQGLTWTEVIAGISEGERVVVEGAYPLLLSTKTGTIPAHGHAH